jgi:cobalamin biosynthesis protein CobT
MASPFINSLPLVASALGRRYGTKVFIGSEWAASDGCNIFLPSLPLDSSSETLQLARGYLDHEAAHIRETDFNLAKKAMLSPFEKHLWNSIEDFRVEKILGTQYPGCRQNFEWLISHFFDHDKSAATTPRESLLNWVLYSLRCMSVPKLGPRLERISQDVSKAFPSLVERLSPILEEIQRGCNSTGDSIAFARKIKEAVEEYSSQSQLAPNSFQVQPEHQGEAENFNDLAIGDKSISDDNHQERPAQKPKCRPSDCAASDFGCMPATPDNTSRHATGDLDAGAYPDLPDANALTALKSLLDSLEGDLPSSFDSMMESSLNSLSEEIEDKKITVARPSPLNLEELSELDILEAKKASAALGSKIQSLLQGLTVKRSMPSHHGRLDTHLIHRLCLKSPKVFRRGGLRMGLSAAVHLLVDASGSMAGHINLASQSAYSICDSLSRVPGVSVAASAFPGTPAKGLSPHDFAWATVSPVLRHNEPMHRKFQLRAIGTTPLAEALWWVLQEMSPLTESRKLVFIITDGEPDSREAAKTAIEEALRIGVEIYGLGINTDSILDILQDRSTVITNILDLPQKLFWLLGRAFTHNK